MFYIALATVGRINHSQAEAHESGLTLLGLCDSSPGCLAIAGINKSERRDTTGSYRGERSPPGRTDIPVAQIQSGQQVQASSLLNSRAHRYFGRERDRTAFYCHLIATRNCTRWSGLR